MKTLAFRYDATQTYRCSEPGDQSGEYVKADAVRGLVEAMESARRYVAADAVSVSTPEECDHIEQLLQRIDKALEDVK